MRINLLKTEKISFSTQSSHLYRVLSEYFLGIIIRSSKQEYTYRIIIRRICIFSFKHTIQWNPSQHHQFSCLNFLSFGRCWRGEDVSNIVCVTSHLSSLLPAAAWGSFKRAASAYPLKIEWCSSKTEVLEELSINLPEGRHKTSSDH